MTPLLSSFYHYFHLFILFVFSGPKDQIESARVLVELVITKGPASLTDPYAMNNTTTVEVKSNYQQNFILKTS